MVVAAICGGVEGRRRGSENNMALSGWATGNGGQRAISWWAEKRAKIALVSGGRSTNSVGASRMAAAWDAFINIALYAGNGAAPARVIKASYWNVVNDGRRAAAGGRNRRMAAACSCASPSGGALMLSVSISGAAAR